MNLRIYDIIIDQWRETSRNVSIQLKMYRKLRNGVFDYNTTQTIFDQIVIPLKEQIIKDNNEKN